MDVRFYPAPPASVGSCTLPTDSGLDYYHPNKVTYLSTLLAHVVSTCADSDAVSVAHEPAHRLIRLGRPVVTSARLLFPSGGIKLIWQLNFDALLLMHLLQDWVGLVSVVVGDSNETSPERSTFSWK